MRLRYPVVVTNHGAAYRLEKWGRWGRRLIRSVEGLSVRMASAPTAVAAAHARPSHALGTGARSSTFRTGWRSASLTKSRLADCSTNCGLAAGEYVLFVARRLDATKGCHTLLEALRRLSDPPQLLVVGDVDAAGAYGQSLRRSARGLPVRFAPVIDDGATLRTAC